MGTIAIFDGNDWIPIGGEGGSGGTPGEEEVQVGISRPIPSTDIWIDTDEPDPVDMYRHVHIQSTPSASWVVVHSLGYHPTVDIEDSAGSVIMGSIHYDDNVRLTISFRTAITGRANCS